MTKCPVADEGKKCILLFSGGRDSFLSCCFLVEQGYEVFLLTFENGAGIASENALDSARRLKKAYGDKVNFLGIVNIAGIWREFFLPYLNMTPSEVIKEWGELTVSQFNCLTCRSAMYAYSIMACRRLGINIIAEGAREDQKFAIEQPGMTERFRKMLEFYGIKLLLPVYDLDSDWKRKNLLLMRGFVPKTFEPQCLLGVPVPGIKLASEIQEAVEAFFEAHILPKIKEIVENNEAITEVFRGEMI